MGIKNLALNRRDIGIATKHRTMEGEIPLWPAQERWGPSPESHHALRRHYWSEDSHRGPFEASVWNLTSQSALKCNVWEMAPEAFAAGWDRRGRDSATASYTHSLPHSDQQCLENVNRCRVVLANTLLGFKGPEVELIAGRGLVPNVLQESGRSTSILVLIFNQWQGQLSDNNKF